MRDWNCPMGIHPGIACCFSDPLFHAAGLNRCVKGENQSMAMEFIRWSCLQTICKEIDILERWDVFSCPSTCTKP